MSNDPHHLHAGPTNSIEDLQSRADRLHGWEAAGKDVFAYFNNGGHGDAVRTPSHAADS